MKVEILDAGNLDLEGCETEQEISDKLDEFLQEKSEELGLVTYRIEDTTYVVGLTVNILEVEEEEIIVN